MKIKYITIEREYGSGGTEIAEKVAGKCGIPCYGAEIMENAAENLHISVDAAQRYEEKITSSFLYSMFVMGQVQSGNVNSLPIPDCRILCSLNILRTASIFGRVMWMKCVIPLLAV